MAADDFTIGVEEEFQVVDPASRELDSERQREVYHGRGSLDDVVDWLLTETNP